MDKNTLCNRIIDYLVVCVNDFADRHHLSYQAAFEYLKTYGALDFLEEHYEIEHTLSFEDVQEDMTAICIDNGGRTL